MTSAAAELLRQKDEARHSVLARRDALEADARSAAADVLAQRAFPISIKQGDVVAGFMPIRSEINPLPLMRRLAQYGTRLALPTIVGRGHPLRFRAWMPGDPLVRRQWGIREPEASCPEVLPDIVIVPLAAFDRRGYRVGYGAGYYDMTLNTLRATKPIVALGIAFAMQEIDMVPTESHDAQLDFILTEVGTLDCRGR